jgi:hypothetical protein
MLEKAKLFVKENPETVKKAGLIGGAVLGAAVVGTILYIKRDSLEFLALNLETLENIETPTE